MTFMRKLSALTSLLLMAALIPDSGKSQTANPWPAHTPGAGIVSALTGTGTNGTTSYATTGLSLPLPANTTAAGHCVLVWESSSSSGTPTFAAQYSAAPTSSHFQAVTLSTAVSETNTSLASTTQTAITAALAASAATTFYRTEVDFVAANGSSATVLTFYYKSSSNSITMTMNAGSYCAWL